VVDMAKTVNLPDKIYDARASYSNIFRDFFIGVDCQEIEVFAERDIKTNREFYARLFTEKEIAYCISKAFPSQHFAVRFAAKEAVIKAVAPEHIQHKSIEILNHKSGKPYIKLMNSELRKKFSLRVSLSHSKSIAIAFVLGHKNRNR
jgi:holo-[acyl-carrier protein] synthase